MAVAEAAKDRTGIWKIAKWAREKSMLPREVPKLSTLSKGGRIAESFDEKVLMFKDTFFPPPPTADLSDIQGFTYPEPEESLMVISADEIAKAIARVKADKAPGPDGIPNRMLKALGTTLVERLLPIFNACATFAYHPRAFKEATTIVLKKSAKGDYTDFKTYRPIALLNTMSKTLEFIMANKITFLAENKGLLPESQMSARRDRGTESALELLVEQIHTIWNQGGNRVASILCLDVAGAFDNVSHQRLIHNLRKRKIPEWIANWVASFLSNRRTTVALGHRTSDVL